MYFPYFTAFCYVLSLALQKPRSIIIRKRGYHAFFTIEISSEQIFIEKKKYYNNKLLILGIRDFTNENKIVLRNDIRQMRIMNGNCKMI